MKKIFYFAVAAFTFFSCAKEVELVKDKDEIPVGEANKESVVIYGSVNPTKTTVDAYGFYSWQTSEKIAVVEEDMTDSSGSEFTLSDATTGAFTGTKSQGKDLVFAVSPQAALSDATEDSGYTIYSLTLPATYSGYVAGTTNAVMVGVPDGEYAGDGYRFIFSHAAALLKFTYVNVPYGTKKFKLTTPESISGTWDFDTTSGVSIDQTTSGGKTVTITLASTVESVGQTMSFFVPVPAGNYTGFSIELQDAAGNTLTGTNKSKTSLDIDLEAGDIFPCPTVTLPVENLASLDYNDDGIASIITANYDDPHNVVTSDGTWVVCAYKNNGMQLNTDGGKVSYITIPSLLGTIKKVVVSGSQLTRYYANSSTTGTSGGVQGASIDGKSYINLTSKTWSTAHIVSSGAAVATHVDVVYTPKEVDHITLTTPPTKTSYTYGDDFDFSGAVVTAYFKDDTNANVTSSVTTDGDTVVGSAGNDKAVTISYGGKTATYNINVAKAEPGLAYATSSYNVAPSSAFETPVLTNPFGVAVTYSSSDTSLVTVDGSSGAVTIGNSAGGPVTITATTTGNSNIKAGSASYTITIVSASPLTAPTNVSISAISSTSFTASWTSSDSNFAWILSTKNTAASAELDYVAKNTTSSKSVTQNVTLTSGTTYYFYVKAVGDGETTLDSGYANASKACPIIISWSRSGTTNTVTSGYTFYAQADGKSGYYQDGSGTKRYVQILKSDTSSPIFSSTPTSITFTAKIGGGTAGTDLDNDVIVVLLDSSGNEISSTATTVTSHITTNTGDDYEDISIPLTTSAYGVRLYHTKETGYNVRYYSMSLTIVK